MNARQREAIELRYVHDFPYQTIADMTGAPVGTIKSRISQGIQKLKAIIGGDRYENDRGEITGVQTELEYRKGSAKTLRIGFERHLSLSR